MKSFVVLFKYAGDWHVDVFNREIDKRETPDGLKLWLIEAARFAVVRKGLAKDGINTITEAMAFEIVSSKAADGSGKVSLSPQPIYAVDTIALK